MAEVENTLVIPDNALILMLTGLLKMLSDNLKEVSKVQTILYRLFGDISYGKYSYFESGSKLFSQSNGKARSIKVKLSFDNDYSSFPTIYIPTGKDDHVFSGIGDIDDEYLTDKDNRQTPVKTCRFKGSSSFVIVSDNIEEVQLIYHTVRALLVGAGDTFGAYGLTNVRLGGADVQLMDELIPKDVFMRALSIDYEYDITVPSMIHTRGGVAGLTATGTPLAE